MIFRVNRSQFLGVRIITLCHISFRLFGCTETVFNMKDDMYHGPQQRRSKTVHEMLSGSTVKASIEQPHDTKILSLKRALNRSCLEKGPPAAKVQRVQVPVVRKTGRIGNDGKTP